MSTIQTDYLVVGAGASGMAFVDALLTHTDVRVVLVDRRHRAGGHWLDAYPFVRLHQPSANYGVASRQLGEDRIDTSGVNAGFYERATAHEICDYYGRVLDDWLAAGRVRFLPMSDYRGEDTGGHSVVSLLSGAETVVTARTFVDATYVESEIPSRHTPSYAVDDDVRLLPPNDLVRIAEAPTGYTVIGAGKTAMDTCGWLLDTGVGPDRITWVRPRDPWLFNRVGMQPLDLVGGYMQMQARWLEAAAEATGGADFARRLEAAGVLMRIDPTVDAEAFRGAIISEPEMASLRTIERVVRLGRVRSIGTSRITLDQGEVAVDRQQVVVDCTAPGARPATLRPIFEPGRITLQQVVMGILPWSTAAIGAVEAMRDDTEDKNRLCPPLAFSGQIADILSMAYTHMTGMGVRGAEPDLGRWIDRCRLNPTAAVKDHLGDPDVTEAFASIGASYGPALANLTALGAPTPTGRRPAQRVSARG